MNTNTDHVMNHSSDNNKVSKMKLNLSRTISDSTSRHAVRANSSLIRNRGTTFCSPRSFSSLKIKVENMPNIDFKTNTVYLSQYLCSPKCSRTGSGKYTQKQKRLATGTKCRSANNSIERKNSIFRSKDASTNLLNLEGQNISDLKKRDTGHTFHRSNSSVTSSKVARLKRCNSAQVALGRKTSNINTQRKLIRRCSEPFLLDPNVLQEKTYRKNSTARNGKRRQSATASFPSASKQKLHELAKDELLANLKLPPPPPFSIDEKDFEEPYDDVFQAQKNEKERKEIKRQRVMEEILETEKNYISCLETLDSVFKKQLEELNIITGKDLCSLFPTQLNQIRISHTFFMHELQDRMNNVNWRGIIGDIFAKMTSANSNLSEIYMNYVQLFPKSISTLSKCTRSSQKFRKFLLDCNENPIVDRLDLPSFLLSPVQRLPRYILLLRELLKYTEDDHPDMYHITQAKKEMEAMISLLNSSIHSSMEFYSANENRRKKMTRQMTSKKNRKQRIHVEETRKFSKNQETVVESKVLSDADLGYCSFSERKDETQEDETNGGNQSLDSSQCSVSNSCRSEEGRQSNGNVRRRKESQPFTRSSLSRKSWRRSLGAVFSNLWSTKDEIAEDIGVEWKPRSESARLSDSFESHFDHTDDIRSRTRNLSRKNGVGTRHPTLQSIDDSPVKIHLGGDIEISSKYSQEKGEHKLSISSSQSSDSIKSPSNNEKFKRGHLRGSAGPVLRSIINRNKIQKAISWNELNLDDSKVSQKKNSISSLKFQLFNSKEKLPNSSPEKHSRSNLCPTRSAMPESDPTLPYLENSSKNSCDNSFKKTFQQCYADESKEMNNAICEKSLCCDKNEIKNPKKLRSHNASDESNNIHSQTNYESSNYGNGHSENIYIDQNSEKHAKKSFMKSFKKMIRKK